MYTIFKIIYLLFNLLNRCLQYAYENNQVMWTKKKKKLALQLSVKVRDSGGKKKEAAGRSFNFIAA